MPPYEIVTLRSAPATVSALTDLLIEAVASGASVTFLHPLARDVAEAFWTEALAEADAGRRVILGAFDGDQLVSTVTLRLDTPQNQQHRAEIVKLITRLSHRGRGIARALMVEAERTAWERGRLLLTLDTAAEEGAAGFYEKLGYIRVGVIPDYAYKPSGNLCGAIFYWKRLNST